MSIGRQCCQAARDDGEDRPVMLSREFVESIRGTDLEATLFEASVKLPEFPIGASAHEICHACAAHSVGQQVGLIERGIVDCGDLSDLPLTDQLFVNLAGFFGNSFAEGHVKSRYPAEWKTYISRARRGASRCDECSCVAGILKERPDATDNEIIDTLRAAERRVRDYFDPPLRRGMVMTAARELHESETGTMAGERLAELVRAWGL